MNRIAKILLALVLTQTNLLADEKRDTIQVKEFQQSSVIGLLKHPLGTIVRATGICIDGDTTRRKKYSGKLLLQIEAVDGEQLDPPAIFVFLRAPNEIRKPEPGERFDYYVHEYGYFDGVVKRPKGLGIPEVDNAHDGFYYRPQLTVHRDLAPEGGNAKPQPKRNAPNKAQK